MTTLYINIYSDQSESRSKELLDCLSMNLRNFDRIIGINNTGVEVSGIVNIMTDKRPTFSDFFKLINTYSKETDVNVISNSDIFFPKNSIRLIGGIKENDCYAISRYNDGSLFLRADSQDSWVFKGWVKHISNCDFSLGVAGNDNSIAHRLSEAGYNVINPCFSVITHHIHDSNVRNYSPFVQTPTPYKHVCPTTLDGCRRFYATSINPYDRLSQQLSAIKSWRKGVVISFNTAKEISDLGSIKGITFVELGENDIVHGKYPKIHSILKWMKHLDFDRFVLINSDIAIKDMSVFNKSLLSPDFVVGVRHDNGNKPFPHGYDVFAFTKKHIGMIPDGEYALGLPWWDFFVPLSLLHNGYQISLIKELPIFTHEWHDTRYDYDKWISMGEYFKRFPAFSEIVNGHNSIPEMCTKTKKFIDSKLKVIA